MISTLIMQSWPDAETLENEELLLCLALHSKLLQTRESIPKGLSPMLIISLTLRPTSSAVTWEPCSLLAECQSFSSVRSTAWKPPLTSRQTGLKFNTWCLSSMSSKLCMRMPNQRWLKRVLTSASEHNPSSPATRQTSLFGVMDPTLPAGIITDVLRHE